MRVPHRQTAQGSLQTGAARAWGGRQGRRSLLPLNRGAYRVEIKEVDGQQDGEGGTGLEEHRHTTQKQPVGLAYWSHTQERDSVTSFLLVIAFGVGPSIRTQSHRNMDWGKLLGGQEVPCLHGFDSSRRFSQQEHTRPAWSGHA